MLRCLPVPLRFAYRMTMLFPVDIKLARNQNHVTGVPARRSVAPQLKTMQSTSRRSGSSRCFST
jgi:hypothetical protein